MKITKYVHSCLLIEEQEKTILIDPGNYTYEAKIFPLQTLSKLDYILITHEHPDHCSLPLIKEILNKFTDTIVITNSSTVDKLQKEDIEATIETPEFITTEQIPHEDVVTSVPPENTQFTLFDTFTDPGDSYHINNTAPIFALPIQAPWGSFASALKLAEALSPKYIIPIHDWHWKDEVRKVMYNRAADYLKQTDIEFRSLETGETIEL